MTDALAKLLDRARAPIDDHGVAAALQRPEPPIEAPPPSSSAPSIGDGPSEPYALNRPGDRARALRAFAESWEGVRYRRGEDSRVAIDNPAFARRCYKEVFGIDLGETPTQIYRASGSALAVDPDQAQAVLQPGDLLFWTSHADRARGVMVYLGGGQMVHAADIRGVVIEEIPRPPYPQYLWLVAKRPLDVHPINK
jgi:cell wall-associated NlpC family hydrolase